MKRIAVSAALGGLAAYLFDPKLGEERRERFYSLWRDNRDTAVQAGQKASRAFESARPVAERVSKAISRRDLAQLLERRRRSGSLPKLIGAAAIGGALMYFLDPVRGSERRRSAIVTGRRAVAKMVESVKTVGGRVGGPSADTTARTKSGLG
jgi:hypothetical protein